MTVLAAIAQSPDLRKAGALTMATVLNYSPAEPYDAEECPAMDDMERAGNRRDEYFDIDELIRRLEIHRQELKMVHVRQKTEALKSRRASIASSYQPRYSRRQTRAIDPQEAVDAMAAYAQLDIGRRPSTESQLPRHHPASRENLAAEYRRGSDEAVDDKQRKRNNRRSLFGGMVAARPSYEQDTSSRNSSRPTSPAPEKRRPVTRIAGADIVLDNWAAAAAATKRMSTSRPVTAHLRSQPTTNVYWPALSIKERQAMQDKEDREIEALRRDTAWMAATSKPQSQTAPPTRHGASFMNKAARRRSRVPDNAEASLRLLDASCCHDDEEKENRRPATSADNRRKRATYSGRNSDASGDTSRPVKRVLKKESRSLRRFKSLFGLFSRKNKN